MAVTNPSGGQVQVTGAGSGGTSSVDETPFVAGSSAGTNLMGVVNPADTPPNGDVAIAALDGARNLKVNVAAGTLTTTPPSSTTATAPSSARKTVGASAILLLAANSNRVAFKLKQAGTLTVYIGCGANPTTSAYNDSLAAGGTTDDGSIAPIYDTVYKGAIYGICASSGGAVAVTEFTP